jgi:hypothetical protein
MNFLKSLGHIVLKVITFGAYAAKDAAPILALIFGPAFSALVTGTATAIITAEATGAAAAQAGADAGANGAQKAALVIASIEPLALQYAKTLGVPNPTQAQLQGWTDGFVAAFNALGLDLSKYTEVPVPAADAPKA